MDDDNHGPPNIHLRIMPRQAGEWRWQNNWENDEHTYIGDVAILMQNSDFLEHGPVPITFNTIMTLDFIHNNPFIPGSPAPVILGNGEEINLTLPDDYPNPDDETNQEKRDRKRKQPMVVDPTDIPSSSSVYEYQEPSSSVMSEFEIPEVSKEIKEDEEDSDEEIEFLYD